MPTTSSSSCNFSSNDIGEASSSNKKLHLTLPHNTRIDKKFIVAEMEVMCHFSKTCVGCNYFFGWMTNSQSM
ncbi:hypothetical protein Scep_012133 [Stephania cephalantha]|uniref:Uncharacterized protein n=1 Tax=Stephania cephalantha TaxID=152367 RepID=A0AAP0JFG4_9MAGN